MHLCLWCLCVWVCEERLLDYSAMSDSENDISWLTQESNYLEIKTGFDVEFSRVDDESYFEGVVSLEDGCMIRQSVLYDNVVAEDISSDEGVDTM